MHIHMQAETGRPPCFTGQGNGFPPFGEPQTRGAAGPFLIGACLKMPSVYEYGDEDLGKWEGGAFEGEKDQRPKRARDCVSLRCFSTLPCGPWLEFCTGFRRVSLCMCLRMCVCVVQMRKSMRILSQWQQVRAHTQAHAQLWDTQTHTHPS